MKPLHLALSALLTSAAAFPLSVAVTLAVMGCLDYFGLGLIFGDRSPNEFQDVAHGRPRDLFWFMLFALVMATSLLAAARRAADNLRRVRAQVRR